MRRAVLVAAAALVSCAPAPLPSPLSERPLVIGIVGDPASLLGDDPGARAVAAAIVEPLVRRSATEDLEPRLAEAVPTFANGELALATDADAPQGRLVATFRLRGGLRWHDGAPIDAGDVRFAFELDRAAPVGTAARAMADRVERVDVVDDRTARVTYRSGDRWDLYALAPRAMPRHLLEGAAGAARARYDARPVHAGPYRIVDRVSGTIVLEAFSRHVLGAPTIPRIVVREYRDRTALLAALLGGDVDVAPSPDFEADLAPTLERSLGGRPVQIAYTQAQAVAMLRFGPRLADTAIREAVSLTIDRDRIARSVFGGRALVPASYLAAPLWAATSGLAPPRLDRVAARALLDAAGATRGSFGIAELRGDRLVVTLIVPAGSETLVEAARGIAVDLAVLGIAVSVSERSPGETAQRVQRDDFDLALVIERADDPLAASDRYRGEVSPWFDVLADAARASDDRADKKALYLEMQRVWSESVPALPIFQLLTVDVVPANVEGIHPAAHSAPVTWNVGEWRAVPPR